MLTLERNENLPKGWAYTTLEEISVTLRAGGTPSTQVSEYYSDGKIPFVKIDDMTSSIKYLDKTKIFINEKGLKNSSAWIVPENSILYSMYASYGIPVINKIPVATSQAIIAYIPFPKLINLEYVYYYLQSIKSKLKPKGTTQGNLNAQIIREIKIKLSPLNEQKRIVEKIEELSSRLEYVRNNVNKIKTLLKKFRESVLLAGSTGELTKEWRMKNPNVIPVSESLSEIYKMRKKTYEHDCKEARSKVQKKPKLPTCLNLKYNRISFEFPDFPKTWLPCTINQLSSMLPRSIQSGPFGSTLHHSEFQKDGILAIGIDNVQNGGFTLGNEHRISKKKYCELEKYSARPNDLLFTVMATIGRCCLVPKNIGNAIITKHVYRVTLDPALCHPPYVLYSISSSINKKYLASRIIGVTRPGINGEILKRTPIILPPLLEQKAISEKIRSLLETIDDIEKACIELETRLESFWKLILKQAFEGKLVSQDPNDEPAEVLLQKIKQEKTLPIRKTGKLSI